MSEHNIKLGVSLYSLTNEYVLEKWDLEECLAQAKEMGFEGIEIVAAQMVPNYPFPTDEWLSYFKGLLEKYELKPVCWSAYIDMGLRSDRDLNEEEIFQYTLNDLIYAKKAGFDLVRTQHAISPKIFKRMIPYCKQFGVKLAIEMHHPHHVRVPVWQEYMEIFNGEGRGILGVVPDFGIFQDRPHQLFLQEALESGFRKELLDEIIALHKDGVPLKEVLKKDLTETERSYTEELYDKFNAVARIEDLEELIPHTPYIHGKFYYLDEEKLDTGIPYEKILTKLKELGYNGYIASEFEGHHFTNAFIAKEQLMRFVKMCTTILNK